MPLVRRPRSRTAEAGTTYMYLCAFYGHTGKRTTDADRCGNRGIDWKDVHGLQTRKVLAALV